MTTSPTPVCFFLATVMLHYRDGDNVRHSYMNVLIESAKPEILKEDLSVMHQSALSRLAQESGVAPADVLDTVVTNISLLAVTTPDIFHGTDTRIEDAVLVEEPVS